MKVIPHLWWFDDCCLRFIISSFSSSLPCHFSWFEYSKLVIYYRSYHFSALIIMNKIFFKNYEGENYFIFSRKITLNFRAKNNLRVRFFKEIVFKNDLIIEKSFKIDLIVWSVCKRHLAIFWANVSNWVFLNYKVIKWNSMSKKKVWEQWDAEK